MGISLYALAMDRLSVGPMLRVKRLGLEEKSRRMLVLPLAEDFQVAITHNLHAAGGMRKST